MQAFFPMQSQNPDIKWPRPHPKTCIVPLFLPFRGCPVRCVFCAQEKQTGQREGQSLTAILDAARGRLLALAQRRKSGGPSPLLPELAFYGGTFTALPDEELQACLDFARAMMAEGLAGTFRCSTRPDCISAGILERLVQAGCATVELGVQSFATEALRLARRGYDGTIAADACRAARTAGLRLGVQLLPGMPGVTAGVFLDDVRRALELGADFLRFYPCLVLEGTGLAALWREGAFAPWELEPTVDILAQGWLLAHRANVPVIRMGLAPEPGLADNILAGPVHPALGDMVLGQAALGLVREAMRAQGIARLAQLDVPKRCQGFFWGQKGRLAPCWQELGLHRGNVRFVG